MRLLGPLWQVGATLLAPLLRLHLWRRARQGKEIPGRLPERLGYGAARPAGRLFWLHAASVGETLSLLPVLEAMLALAPELHLLLTTGTVTSARLFADRLPEALRPRVAHRFVPLDVPAWCARFLDGWQPDAAAFVESELWPNLLREAARRGLPMALVNARMSAASARRWGWAPGLARSVLGRFRLVLAQTSADAARLATLGAAAPRCLGNLKDAAPPLPADPTALAALRGAVGARPLWLAASTHPGEEAMVLAAHASMAARLPDLLTVIVPRHPERGAAVAAEAAALGLAVTQRSGGALPGPGTAIYVADTLGELGLFYRLAPLAFIGGSLVPHGGQNPLEPARLGCAILLGPHSWNFADPVGRLLAAEAALPVADTAALAATALDVLTNPGRGENMAKAAAALVATSSVATSSNATASTSTGAPLDTLPGQVAQALLELLPAGTTPAGTD
jgi:3-deoxy-D-manno-octulosonic-acid transferase